MLVTTSAERSTADPATRRAALGWRMQLIRAEMWAAAGRGDAWVRLLLDGEDDDTGAVQELLAGGPVTRSVLGATVVTDPRLGAELLHGEALCSRADDGLPPRLQVLDLATLGIGVDRPDGDPWPALEPALVRATMAEPLSRALAAGGERVDLAPAARAGAVAVAAALSGAHPRQMAAVFPHLATCLDAPLSPQRLDDAWALLRSGSRLRVLLRELGIDPVAQQRRAAELAVLAAVLDRAVLGTARRVVADETLWRRLGAGGAGIGREVAERVLVDDPPVRCHLRLARRDLVLGGHPVPRGEPVVVLDTGAGAASCAADPILSGLLGLVAEAAAGFAAVLSRRRRPHLLPPLRARRSPAVRRFVEVPVQLGGGHPCA